MTIKMEPRFKGFHMEWQRKGNISQFGVKNVTVDQRQPIPYFLDSVHLKAVFRYIIGIFG